jgi:TonB family protein
MKVPKPLLFAISSFLTIHLALAVAASRPSSQATGSPEVVAAAAPVYPPIAVAARAMSDVVVDVKISPDGHVSAADAVSGHPLLQQAAKVAARRWRFEAADAKSGIRTARLTFVFRISDKQMPDSEATTVFMPPYRVEVTRNPPVLDATPSY